MRRTGDPTPDDLVALVEATGCTATVLDPGAEADTQAGDADADRDGEAAGWWQRLVISAVLT